MMIMDNRPLTDAEKNEIAELAADKAYSRFYQAVGHSVVKKVLWVIGAAAMFAWYVLQNGEVPK
jgi:hypothetical protein